jgi:hypothetical protein
MAANGVTAKMMNCKKTACAPKVFKPWDKGKAHFDYMNVYKRIILERTERVED